MSVRVCLIYDCLFPYTIGGAERWYRNLGERLASDGHEVEYLTLRQWDRGVDPGVPGVLVRAVGPRMRLYSGLGRRRILPPLVFGLGVLWHLLRHGRRYDVVHTASFPYFSLLAAGLVRPLGRYRLIVDWHEVWSREYWREYLGRWAGEVGWRIQVLCVRMPQRAFCFSRLHAERLRSAGLTDVTLLGGQYVAHSTSVEPAPARPVVVFAGRHIPEKQVETLVPAVALAAERIPGLRGIAFGDGPTRPVVQQAIDSCGARGVVEAPGFVTAEVLSETLCSALCMLLPSRREGYGMVVVESAALGVPSVVVAGPDNAAVELVAEGENGTIAPSSTPDDLAGAIIRIQEGGAALRAATLRWYERNAERLSLSSALETVVGSYSHVAITSDTDG